MTLHKRSGFEEEKETLARTVFKHASRFFRWAVDEIRSLLRAISEPATCDYSLLSPAELAALAAAEHRESGPDRPPRARGVLHWSVTSLSRAGQTGPSTGSVLARPYVR